jgi:L-ascorbate metabolism protein UlaG (beta-lactamase superfamily)
MMSKPFLVILIMTAVLIMLAVAFTLVACRGDRPDNPDNPNPDNTEEPEKPHDVRLYQLAPEQNSLMMSYVIVTPNNKVVVFDGGIAGQGKDAPPYLPAAIRAILGLPQDGYFEIEAWFLTHGHDDHMGEIGKMTLAYTAESNYKINNIYFYFPDFGVEWKSQAGANDYSLEAVENMKKGLDNYYSICGFNGLAYADIPESEWKAPEGSDNYYYNLINGAVVNRERVDAGLVIEVDGVKFNVLQTWQKSCTNVNSTSTVVRMVYGDHSVLFLGDSYTDNSNKLVRKYGDELKSEYIQMGHHGQHGPNEKFYKKIEAEKSIRLWPTPIWVWKVYKATNNIATDETRGWLGLPKDYAEFEAQGLLDTGRDFISGLYGIYPADPTQVSDWNKDVLAKQLVAVFEYVEPAPEQEQEAPEATAAPESSAEGAPQE